MDTIIGGEPGKTSADGASGNGALIKNSDTANFVADVIEASRERPVIVDFWAEWCGPCRQLGPMLEKAVGDASGAVSMVKIDVDANQALAAQLRIQSIPTVYAFRNGQPVDAFQGALPESQLKAWIKGLIDKHGGAPSASPMDDALAAARAAEDAGDNDSAAAIYSQIRGQEPNNIDAIAGLGRTLIASHKLEEAKALLGQLDDEARQKDEVQAVQSALDLAEEGAAAAARTDELEAAVAADPNAHQARFDLAMALYASGDPERAMQELLEIIRRKPKWNDDAARLQLLKFFEALGPTDPRTVDARRQLSSVLFS